MPRWTPFEPYFWSLVQKTEGCWLWLGNLESGGYGRVWRNRRRVKAHRVAWELTNGPIPDGLFACHHCDNKKCVRPDHIFLGTPADNMQDWTRKGKNRLANDRSLWQRGDQHWTHRQPERAHRIVSTARKQEWASGRRTAIRGEGGRIMGTRMVP